ncbi:MAG: hypothetical protein IT206_02080 [Fimbriimonadaceae bacterium]|nr:hypothetical protein [Fimbriimonadaceae bacterium]
MKYTLALLILVGSLLVIGCQGGAPKDAANEGAGTNQGNDSNRGESGKMETQKTTL